MTASSLMAVISDDTPSSIPTTMPSTKDPHWFFTKEQLDQSPSHRCGFDSDKELYYRQQTASFIQEMGTKLQLTSTCICTAIVYAHRFYVFHSFQRFPRNDLAAACLFLAAKVQECPRKLEYVVKVSYALQHREEPTLDARSDQYLEEAQKIITYENILLQTLGFDIDIDLPHTHVVRYIQRVKGLTTPNKDLAQAAYFFATDILHVTSFCLRYRPSVVACVCIHLACNWAKWEIPEHEGKQWYYYLDQNVTKETIEALSHEFTDVCARSGERLKIKRYIGRSFASGNNSGPSNSHDDIVSPTPPSAPGSTSNIPSTSRPHSHNTHAMPPGIIGASNIENKSLTDNLLLSPPAATTIRQDVRNERSTPDKSMSPSVVKKQNLDLKCYKERREKEKEANVGGTAASTSFSSTNQSSSLSSHNRLESSNQPAVTRKSFMPQVSGKEALASPPDFGKSSASAASRPAKPPPPPLPHSSESRPPHGMDPAAAIKKHPSTVKHHTSSSSSSSSSRPPLPPLPPPPLPPSPPPPPPSTPNSSATSVGADRGSHSASSSDHRRPTSGVSGGPTPSSADRRPPPPPQNSGSDGVDSRKRPLPTDSSLNNQVNFKIAKVDHRLSSASSSSHHNHSQYSIGVTSAKISTSAGSSSSKSSKERPPSSSSSSSSSYHHHHHHHRLPPPKPENDEITKAIINELDKSLS